MLSELRLSRVTRLVPSWGVFSVGQVALVSQDSEQGSVPTPERRRFQASCGDSPRGTSEGGRRTRARADHSPANTHKAATCSQLLMCAHLPATHTTLTRVQTLVCF